MNSGRLFIYQFRQRQQIELIVFGQFPYPDFITHRSWPSFFPARRQPWTTRFWFAVFNRLQLNYQTKLLHLLGELMLNSCPSAYNLLSNL